jgi:hypothetical protein
VVAAIETASGRTARRQYRSILMMHAARTLLARVNPALSRLIQLGVLMDTTDQTVDISSLLAEFPTSLRRFDDVIRARFAPVQGQVDRARAPLP